MTALEEDEQDYTYHVNYKRLRGHRTYHGKKGAIGYVKHRFSEGSLVLLENAIHMVRQEVR
jgi:hypothetical protein